ncbi:hypothetical protein [Clostridium botulinum]|nr:hypothetical protein [Clostridium botulinum]EDT84648.1 hypothetical protein CBB_1579 [Clostridium botulinum Bf]
MNKKNIKVKVIMGENTPNIITEALLKLYDNNAAKVLNLDEKEKQS